MPITSPLNSRWRSCANSWRLLRTCGWKPRRMLGGFMPRTPRWGTSLPVCAPRQPCGRSLPPYGAGQLPDRIERACRSGPSTASSTPSTGRSSRSRSGSGEREAAVRAADGRTGGWSTTSAMAAGGTQMSDAGVTAGGDGSGSQQGSTSSVRLDERGSFLPLPIAMPYDPRPAGASEAAMAHAVSPEGIG
jgi:hypothetical protein